MWTIVLEHLGRFDEAVPSRGRRSGAWGISSAPGTPWWRRHLLAALVRLYEARGESAQVARFQAILDEAMEEAARVAAGSGS